MRLRTKIRTAVMPSAFAGFGSPSLCCEEEEWGDAACHSGLSSEPQLLSFPCPSSPCLVRETPGLVHMTDWRGEEKRNNAKPPARADFPVTEDGNNKTKDRFLPSRNSLFIAAKATQNSRQTFHYFPPTVWKYGERKSCHDFFFPSSSTRSDTFFFFSIRR